MLPFTVGLAIENKELWDEVQSCLQSLPVRVVMEQGAIEDKASFLDRIERMRPDVLLLDVTKVRGSLEDLVGEIRATSVQPTVMAVHLKAEPEAILSVLRAGVNEFLYPPLQVNIKKALERKSGDHGRARERARTKGKVVGFLSVKGGCGATTLACHTAVELGRHDQNVLLADMDLDAGMIRFLMKSKSPYSLVDAINNLHRLDLSYWKALVSNGYPGVEVIAAPAALTLEAPPAQDQLQHVVSFFRSQYDWTVLDLGRSLNLTAIRLLDDVDETFLVTTLDIPALHQAKQMIQTLLDGGFGRHRLRLVLNQMPNRLDVTPDELEKMLSLPVYAMLPSDHASLYESYSEGKLLGPNSPLGKHLARMTAKLAGIEEVKAKRKFSLFGN